MVTTAAIIYAAWSLGMSERVHGRYTVHAFPTVISAMFHGLPWNYTAYEGVTKTLLDAHNTAFDEARGLGDAALHSAATLTNFDTAIRLFPFDDKGYADLTWIAFTVFGLSVASVFWAYVLLFAGSVAAFLVGLHRDVAALVLINILLAGTYAAIFAFPVSRELGEITNPRAIGLLGLMATAHLLYISIRGARLSVAGVAAVAAQSALLAFVVFCRSPEIWQVGAIVLTAGISIGVSIAHRRRSAQAAVIALGALAVSMAGLIFYQWAYFHPDYFTTHGRARLIWHNVGIGFALNPQLSKEYRLSVSDGPMFALVAERAKSRGIYDTIFTDSDQLLLNPVADFVTYDSLAQEMVLEIVADHPWQAFLTFAIYKPLAFARTLLDATRDHRSEQSNIEEAPYVDKSARAKLDAYLNPFRPWPLVVVAVYGLVAISKREDHWLIVPVVVTLWIGGTLPGLAGYPLYHIIGMQFATTCAVLYVLIAAVVALITTHLFRIDLSIRAST
jgi:hypothetical protein